MADLVDGFDATLADMAGHQRRFAGEVTADANRRLAADAFQRLENEQAEAKPHAPQPEPVAPPSASTTVRDGQHGRYVVDVGQRDDLAVRPATTQEHWFLTHAMPRIELLLTKLETGPLGTPSWAQRTQWVLNFKRRSNDFNRAGMRERAEELDLRYMYELGRLLDDSSTTFGDWRKDAPTKITVSG